MDKVKKKNKEQAIQCSCRKRTTPIRGNRVEMQGTSRKKEKKKREAEALGKNHLLKNGKGEENRQGGGNLKRDREVEKKKKGQKNKR